MAAGRTQPAHSKNEAIAKIERPNTWGYLRMLIGIFGFYIQFLPIYELDIIPWRYILSKQPQPGAIYQNENMELPQNLWNTEDQRLLERLKKDILSGPNLARPDPSRRFYIRLVPAQDGLFALTLWYVAKTLFRS